MYKALFGTELIDPADYHRRSLQKDVNETLRCSDPECGVPVYAYGKSAILFEVIGVKNHGMRRPSFHHYKKQGLNCPLRLQTGQGHKNSSGQQSHLQQVTFSPDDFIDTLAVWGHIFKREVTAQDFRRAKDEATRAHILNLRKDQTWAVPFMLAALAIQRTASGQELKLDLAADNQLVVVDANTSAFFNGPFEPNQDSVANYRTRLNIAWAKSQANPELTLR